MSKLDEQKTTVNRWKLPARYTAQVFAFYMAAIMALLMSAVIVAANTGIGAGFLSRVSHAYQLAMPAAFLCILFVRPIVMKLVTITIHK
ncbi:DUF2798 domain-containing protein [Undibacterium parvum]|jgi:hypothetical protein|uniref:DUF2798 domain-containing protein n=2 Tax=Undibacterium TaxID=401469 RepID=A0A6M4A4H5_9BURK|nr:DUF2798 domain-containing protein [Undibacterium parvum]AZP10891.1 DUF2798 domain-containing protein [Undibacterium parvum]QJQ05467.1 DUF2798 domain-containing protein [Undibacterium piscinae]